ncbi:MAG TPA: oligopeptide/dipeptide ABC transporter ATP-binding protein [Candidatus Limnocylindrales bacterium]|nr:oligopeptide/dipeptide ABC transporter ATP-binding protein [Candidatus Limnocylindrales bacterium]
MTATVGATPIAEPRVHHRLRRRPPGGVRNGRALLMSIAGYSLVGLFVVLLGVPIGIKAALSALPIVALIALPLTAIMVGVTRFTRARTKLALAVAVGVAVLIAVLVGYLIVTMSTRLTEPNSIFFAQLGLTAPFVLAIIAAWQFLKAASWFDGTVEKPLRAEESGARPIATPLISDGAATVAVAGPEIATMGSRIGAYVVDAILVIVVTAVPYVLATALGLGGNALLIALAVGSVLSTVYFPSFWHITGQTPGMRLAKVRVIHEIHPGPISWGSALKRYIVFVFGAAALYIGWLWAFIDPRRKAWHDLAADTIVIDASSALTGTQEAAIAAETAERSNIAIDDPTATISIAPIAAEVARPVHVPTNEPLVSVQGLKKHFPIYGGVLRRQIGTVYAVDGVDFEVFPGETFSLVGESGCGKTTLGRTVIQLTPSTDGRVVFDGYELADVDPDDMRPLRRRMQIIFQDPFGSLNPRMPVSDLIGEGLLSQGLSDRRARDKRVEDSLELVGLRREYSRRYPHEFSGGQRQRIGVARALALGPDFIVADEPVSALDVSIQSQVLNLLLDLKRDLNLTYLFISHNLSVVQYFSDRVGVMYLGKIVEVGTVDQLYHGPRHPYTVALLSAIPAADPRRRKKRLVLRGDVPSPAAPPSGCRFHTRCWLRERLGNPENCVTVEPPLVQFGEEAGHRVACHWADEISQETVQQAEAETPAVVLAAAEDE